MIIKKLHKLFLDCNSISTDTRKISKDGLFFALKGTNFNGNTFAKGALNKGAKYVIIDEENYYVSHKTILVDNVLTTLQELAKYHISYLNIPIIALTGSNGKTTTKELINAVLSKKFKTKATIGNLNNHIGVPLTLLSMTKDTEIGIVEMGANHLNEINFLCQMAKPDFGYITNFGKAHLEGFGSLEGVIKGKTELYNYLIKNNNQIFINAEDNKQVLHSKKAKTVSFGSKGANVTIALKEAQPFVKVNYKDIEISSKLIGSYNYNNIAAAICIGHYFKVDALKIKEGIEHYIPENNRSQIINKDSNKIILDAYNANPTSMHAALTNLNDLKINPKIAILGDMFELGNEAKSEHQNIADYASSLDIDQIILVGENFNIIKINSIKITKYSSFEDLKVNFKIIKNATLLIKGSRGMALERILELL